MKGKCLNSRPIEKQGRKPHDPRFHLNNFTDLPVPPTWIVTNHAQRVLSTNWSTHTALAHLTKLLDLTIVCNAKKGTYRGFLKLDSHSGVLVQDSHSGALIQDSTLGFLIQDSHSGVLVQDSHSWALIQDSHSGSSKAWLPPITLLMV